MSVTAGKSDPNDRLRPEGERSCPICGAAMLAVGHQGVSVDECAEHGIWLDHGELEKIVLRAKGMTRRAGRRAARDARRQGKIEGSFLGWISLLWD